MNIEKRIRAIAAKKVKVIITGKIRSREGFTVTDPNGNREFLPNRKGALNNLLARVRCWNESVWKLEPTKPNSAAAKATLATWGKKMLP